MAYFRSPLLETDGLLGRLPVAVAPPPAVVAAPPAVVAPVAAPMAVAAPAAAWTGHDAFNLPDAKKALQGWLSGGGSLPMEETEGGSSLGEAYVNDLTFRANPDYYGGGYQIQRGNVTYAFDPQGNLQSSYTQNDRTVNTFDSQGNLIRSYTPQGGFGGFLSGLVRPALTVASIVPSPIQPFAQVANAAMAVHDGKPLNAALSLVGAGNSSGLLGSVGDAASAGSGATSGSSIYSLGNAQLGDVAAPGGLYDLGSANLGNATGLGGTGAGLSATTDIFSGIGGSSAVLGGSGIAPNVYDITTGPPVTSPNGEGLSTGPVNGGTGSGLSAAPGAGLTLADPGAANGLLGGSPSAPSIEGMIQQAKAAGKSVTDWMKDPANSLYVKAAMMAGGALLNTVGGKSDSGGSGYKDDGYRPTISRGGFQASIPASGTRAPGMPSGGSGTAPGGVFSGVTLPSTGQANDGLWRFAGNRQGGLLPGLASAMPQTGLIGNYNPTGGMREMVPTNSPQPGYGYDDPVVNGGPQLTAEQQRLMSPLLGLLNTPPTRGWM